MLTWLQHHTGAQTNLEIMIEGRWMQKKGPQLQVYLLPPARRAKLPPKCVVPSPASMKRRNTWSLVYFRRFAPYDLRKQTYIWSWSLWYFMILYLYLLTQIVWREPPWNTRLLLLLLFIDAGLGATLGGKLALELGEGDKEKTLDLSGIWTLAPFSH